MLRGLYLANHNMADVNSGVTKKIRAQISAFENLGCLMEEGMLFQDSTVDKIVRRMPVLSSYFDRESLGLAKSLLEADGLDFVYLRHGICDRYSIELLRYLHGNGVCTVIEFPTYPYDRNSSGLKWKLQLAKDKRWRLKMAPYVAFGTDYSGFEEIYGIPCMKLSNGIAASRYTPRAEAPDPDRLITFIGVALVTYWNGYDRLIRAMYQRKQSGAAGPRLRFNVVGDGEEMPNLRKLVEELGMEDEVVFHGFLSGDALERVYEASDIGVGSLSPSRKYKGHMMSSLKTKEYAAVGLPFIKGDVDAAFDLGNCDFAFDVSDDEKPIDLAAIIGWYQGLVAKEPAGELAHRIHSYSETYLSWEAQLAPVLDRVREYVACGQECLHEQV